MMRRAYGKHRRRGLLESPLLIPALAAAGIIPTLPLDGRHAKLQ